MTPGYPYGNPNLPYFKVHGSDLPWVFGYLEPLRDAAGLFSIQLSVGYYSSFIRSGQPNPSEPYMRTRGYDNVLESMLETGPWEAIGGADGPIRVLNWPSRASGFIDKPQCAFLNYSITYYLDS